MQILYGNVQTNITRELVKRAELSGKQVFYLVPTSISVEKESEVLSLLKNHTAIDIQVLSFKRLAWFFLRNDKYYKEVKLTEVGRVMLFRKTLEEMKEQDLGEYSGLKGNIGFIEELSKLHNDIKNAGLSVDALIGEEKFEILRKIMTNFEENLKGNFRLENEISLLKEKIKEIKNFKAENILIIIDGYSRLTGSERELLDEFQSLGVEILLGTYISKRALKQQNISGNIYEDAIKFVNTFRNVKYISLEKESEIKNKAIEKFLKEWEIYYELNYDNEFIELKEKEGSENFEIWEVPNKKEEIINIAKKIRWLIADEGYRYSDIKLLTGNINDYEEIIKLVFDSYNFPYHLSNKKLMRNHPIIVFISSIFALREYGYKNEDFISFLKTGLLEIFEDEKEEQFIIDKFEHELFRRGVNKRSDLEKNWEAFDENDDSEKILLEKFNKIKNFLIKKDSKIQKFIKTPSLENFIEIMKLTEKRLNNITDNLIKEGNNEKADEYFMAFNKVKDIAREYQGIYEDKEEYFIELFETGLKEASFKTVPQGLERIEIANYDLVRPREKKIIFAVGLIQENFPKLKKNQSILSDKEIEKLNEICKEKGIEDGFTNYKKENGRRALYTATLLFSSAQEKLFLSYPKIYEEKEAGESKFIKVLKDELKIKTIKKTFVNEDNADIKQVASEKNLLKDILELSRRLIKKEKLKKENYFWINLYKLLIKKNKDIREFFRGLDGEELGVKKISNESIEKIYPNIIYASVSRFETFFQCNYRYFLENTLQIKEIEKLNLDSRVLGNYVHKVLEKVFNEHMQFEDFNKNLLAAMENIGKEYEKYFSYSANNKYLYLQYKNILMASKNIFTKQIEKNIFPIETEFSFGNHNDECRPLIFDVENKKLEVRGYIDRIDRIDGNLGAVDYKIGQKDFNKDEAMDGLQLQLLTYLDVIKNYKKYNSNLWGAAYMQVKERDILFKDLKDDISLKNAMEQIDKKSNLSGIFVYDNLHNLDDLKEIYNIGSFKKDGTPYKNNKRVTSNDDLNILLARNRENLIYAGEKIAKGEVEINPVAKIKKTGEVENLVCEYCPFNAICGFEKDIHKPRILGNR